MIVKASDLPTAEEAQISPALRRVSGWRLDNHEAGPSVDEALAFAKKHKTTFFQSMRETLRKIDDRLHSKPAI